MAVLRSFVVVPRMLRVEYAGAIYHLMSRGDRREQIYYDDVDRQDFLKTLAEACQKTGFEVHAYCLMKNHFHLVVETPNANLVSVSVLTFSTSGAQAFSWRNLLCFSVAFLSE